MERVEALKPAIDHEANPTVVLGDDYKVVAEIQGVACMTMCGPGTGQSVSRSGVGLGCVKSAMDMRRHHGDAAVRRWA